MKQRYEKGQAIVLIAAIMVGLIAMLGLAIDGGGLFFLKRDLQNATDAAIIAATYAKCSGGTPAQIREAGIVAAKKNGFVNGTDANGNTTTITVLEGPPPGVNVAHPNEYVRVSITSAKEKYFIQLVYSGDMDVTANAVGHCRAGNSATGGNYAVFGRSTSCQNSIDWAGSTTTINGNVHTNRDVHIGGQRNVVNGIMTYVTTLDAPADKISFNPSENNPRRVAAIPEYPVNFRITDYAPGGSRAQAAAAAGKYFVYTCSGQNDKMTSSWLISRGYLNDSTGQLREGLYYAACGIDIGRGDLKGKATFAATGEISMSGSSHVLTPYIDGLLAFTTLQLSGGAQCNNKVISYNGSTHDLQGIIFAPGGLIELSGSTTRFRGALIGNTVKFNGSDNIITFDPGLFPSTPPIIEIVTD